MPLLRLGELEVEFRRCDGVQPLLPWPITGESIPFQNSREMPMLKTCEAHCGVTSLAVLDCGPRLTPHIANLIDVDAPRAVSHRWDCWRGSYEAFRFCSTSSRSISSLARAAPCDSAISLANRAAC